MALTWQAEQLVTGRPKQLGRALPLIPTLHPCLLPSSPTMLPVRSPTPLGAVAWGPVAAAFPPPPGNAVSAPFLVLLNQNPCFNKIPCDSCGRSGMRALVTENAKPGSEGGRGQLWQLMRILGQTYILF